MRISTAWGQQTSLTSMLDQQARLNRTQQQLASGLKNLAPSDDPVVAKKVLDLTQGIDRTEQYVRNIGTADSRNSLEETVLDGVQDLYYRAQEITITARNAPLSVDDKQSLKQEIDLIIDNLAGLSNTRGPNSEFIFSGDLSKQEAVSYNPVTESYGYEGGLNQRKIAIDITNQVADGELADNVFFGIDSVSDAVITTEGGMRSVFDTLKSMSLALSGQYEVPQATITGDTFLKYGVDYSAAGGAKTFDLTVDTTGTETVTIPAGNYTNIADLVDAVNLGITNQLALAGNVKAYADGNNIQFQSLTEGSASTITISDAASPAGDGVLTDLGFKNGDAGTSIDIGASMTSQNALKVDYSNSPEQFQLIGTNGETVDIELSVDFTIASPPAAADASAKAVVAAINAQIALPVDQSGIMGAKLADNGVSLELHSISAGSSSSIQIKSTYGSFLRDTGFEEGQTARLFDSTSADVLDDLDGALNKLISAKSDTGGRMKILENQTSQHEDFILNMQTVLSDIQDLDYAEAISRFETQLLSLKAAQQSFSKVQGLSLFNYL